MSKIKKKMLLPIRLIWNNIYLTSDTHYSHKNICRGVSIWDSNRKTRDFNTIEEMNSKIVENINSKVAVDDLLIHLGDWSFGGVSQIKEFRDRLNVQNIILIRGNHDQYVHNWKHLFLDVLDIGYYKHNDRCFVACHYPMFHWHQQEKGSFLFHGHLHGEEDRILKSIHRYRAMDVGVDALEDFSPIHINEAINRLIKNKTHDRH